MIPSLSISHWILAHIINLIFHSRRVKQRHATHDWLGVAGSIKIDPWFPEHGEKVLLFFLLKKVELFTKLSDFFFLITEFRKTDRILLSDWVKWGKRGKKKSICKQWALYGLASLPNWDKQRLAYKYRWHTVVSKIAPVESINRHSWSVPAATVIELIVQAWVIACKCQLCKSLLHLFISELNN